MTTLMTFIKRHPVLTYFILTFAISWGGSILVIGPAEFPGTPEEIDRVLPIAIVTLLAGPSLSGILLTGLVNGKAGYRDFVSRLLKWWLHPRWYAIALLTAPALYTAILLILSLLSPTFLPGLFTVNDKVGHLLFGLIVGLMAGVFEELGWTGFAIPMLRLRHGVLATGLIVGLLWAGWHLLFAVWLSGAVSGALSLSSFLLDPLLYLVIFRILMVWVYDRTESLFIGMLLHVSLTASTRILSPVALAGASLMTFDIVWAVAMCSIVGAIAIANHGHLTRQSFDTKMVVASH